MANSLIIILGAVAGTLMTASVVRAEPAHSTFDLVGMFAALGTVLSVAVNGVIIQVDRRPGPAGRLERVVGPVCCDWSHAPGR